ASRRHGTNPEASRPHAPTNHQRATMIRPLTHDSAPRLMEEEGIGYYFAASHEKAAGSSHLSNVPAMERSIARPETFDADVPDDQHSESVAGSSFLSGVYLHPIARIVTDNKDDDGRY